jgi:hypothetical protein
MADPTFADRMFLGGQAVYESIARGELPSVSAVEAALLDVQVTASTEETTNG